MFPHGEDVVLERSGGRDRWGDPLPRAEVAVAGVAFAPRASTEQTGQGNATVIVGVTMYVPAASVPDAGVRAHDVIRRGDGSRWHVVGEPGEWRSPFTGWRPGVEVALERVTG